MAERCKLLYNGEKYFDEDLRQICIKESEFNKAQFKYYSFDRDRQVMTIYTEKDNADLLIEVPFAALHLYKIKKKVVDSGVLEVNGKKYFDSDVRRVGQEVASLYGASCLSYKINKRSKKILFNCVEHGEFYSTEISFDDLKEYSYLF